MSLIIREINNKEVWERALTGIEEKTFLQSWNWGEFQKMIGAKVWRLGIYNQSNSSLLTQSDSVKKLTLSDCVNCVNDGLAGVAQVLRIVSRRGIFLFLPHGPLLLRSRIFNFQFSIFKHKVLKTLINELKIIAKKEKCGFIRIAPIWERNEENKKIFADLGFRQAVLHTHPELTWQLNLEKSENELLMDMRKTTRYLIKQGLKTPELKIEQINSIKGVEIFNKIYQKTAQRHSFVPFSWNYLKKEFLAFNQDTEILVFLAKYKQEYISASMIIYWQAMGFYHQGASLQKYPQIPGSYLLQWHAIQEAKKRGCKIYNFWGIAPSFANAQDVVVKKTHPWYGLSLFKMGFGGDMKVYLKTQDLPLSKKYWLTYIFEKIRKFKRRL